MNEAEVEIFERSRISRSLSSVSTKATEAGMRSVPLANVAAELGLRKKKDKHKYSSERHTISINGSKFYDWKDMKGGGGAIDSGDVRQRYRFQRGWSLAAAIAPHEAAVVSTANQQVREMIRELQRLEFVPPVMAEENWSEVINYLTKKRKLPSLFNFVFQAATS